MVNIFFKNCALSALLSMLTGLFILSLPYQLSLVLLPIAISSVCIFRFPKTILVLVAIFLLFQSFIVFQFTKFPQLETTIKRFEEFAILAAFMIMLLKNMMLKRILWKRTDIDVPLLFLVVIAIYSSIKSQLVSPQIAGFDLFLLLKGFMAFYIFSNLNFTTRDIDVSVKIIFSISLLILFLGAIDLATPYYFRSFTNNNVNIDYRFGIPSVQSIFTHPGAFGWFAAFMACFCFAFYLIYERKKYALFCILFFIATLFSMRLKPIIGMAAAICVGFILVSAVKKVRLIFVLAIAVLLVSTVLGAPIKYLIHDKIYGYIQTSNIDNVARNVLYKTSVQIAAHYFPFGSGLGTFGGWIASLFYSPLYSQYGISQVYGLEEDGHFLNDTFWPYIMGEFGVLGLLSYCYIILVLIRRGIAAFRTANIPLEKAFALGAVLVLIEGICESMASPIFSSPPAFYFIFACLGIAHSLGQPRSDSIEYGRAS